VFLAILLLACTANLLADLKITTTSLPGGMIGVPYGPFQLQASGVVGTPSWSTNPDPLAPGLSISQSGLISGTPTTIGTFHFTATINDQGAVANQDLSISISACTPTISPASLPDGDVGIPYPFVSFSAVGCSGEFTFTAQAISPFNPNPLPPGLALSLNGTLSGTPTQVGPNKGSICTVDCPFDVTANGPNQSTVTSTYSITINPLPTISTASPLPNGLVGVLYSQQIAATGGTPGTSGYVFSMNNNPPGLTMSRSGLLSGTPPQTGTFSFNIGVTDSLGGQSSSPFQVTFITGTAAIQVSPTSLTFNADFQGSPPRGQSIAVVPAPGPDPPLSFSVVIVNAPSWISVSPTTGTAPAGLVVSVDQGTMPAGPYAATIQVLDSNNIPIDVAVTLNVKNTAQQLNVDGSAPGMPPPMLRFGARADAPASLVKDLLVSNAGAIPLAFTASVTGGSSWITGITPSSGQTVRTGPVFLQVQVSTSGLSTGSYHDVIHVASAAGNVDVPISLFVASSGPLLAVNTTGTLFQARQGGGSSAKHDIEILNIGDPNSTVNWTASLLSGSNWLDLVTSSGTATPAAPGTLSLALFQNATQLSPGVYYALVKIADPNPKSLNSPEFLSAVLNLLPDSAAAAPDVAPAGMFFTAIAGGTAPNPQQVLINTSSGSPVPFQVATSTTDQGSWLSAAPSSGTADGQTPGNVSVSVNPSGLAPGVYTGDVNVSISGLLQSVNVTFVVLPSTASSSISHLRSEVVGCTPSKLAITEIGLANNFAVPAGWPATLIVQLNDDCGSLVLNGNVVASFSNGDPALQLVGDSLGNYSTTWAPSAVTPEMVVILNATSGALQPAADKLYGGIAQNQTPPPTLAQGGTLNNLNPVVGAALAPGLVAQVYGSGLAPSPVSINKLPLPELFDNTFAQVGAYQAPFYFLSSGQVNIQLPSELTAPLPQQIPIVLSVNYALSTSVLLDIVPTAPGVLSSFDGPSPQSPQNGAHVIAQHSNFTLVSSKSPAKPSEYLMMYLVGLGATNPSVLSGMPAPSTTLAKVTNAPTVMVDKLPATVAFAGLTPGFVGLYQINFQVPAGAHSGEVEVDVVQNGVAANPTMLAVGQ
jgi:uncharacterized protein (TIGR03437 family)